MMDLNHDHDPLRRPTVFRSRLHAVAGSGCSDRRRGTHSFFQARNINTLDMPSADAEFPARSPSDFHPQQDHCANSSPTGFYTQGPAGNGSAHPCQQQQQQQEQQHHHHNHQPHSPATFSVPPSHTPAFPRDDAMHPPSLQQPRHDSWPMDQYPSYIVGGTQDSFGSFYHPESHCIGSSQFTPNPMFGAIGTSYNPPPPPPPNHGVLTPELSPPHTALSLGSDHEWASPTSPENDDQSLPQKIQMVNKALRSSSPVQRPDGVRKKNAKFDIPDGRTIDTIDHLIKKAKDDNLIKELKTQKRLLKNREAALQSRQRKKQHTEALEVEKKNFVSAITSLRDDLELARSENDDLRREKADLTRKYEKFTTEHENEVARLRTQMSALQDQLRSSHSTPVSTVPSSTGYTDFAGDVGNIAFNTSDWSSFHNEFYLDNDDSFIKKETATEPENPIASAQLQLTLMMYGAHVAQQMMGNATVPLLPESTVFSAAQFLQDIYAQSEISQSSSQLRHSVHSSQPSADINSLVAFQPHVVADFKRLVDTNSGARCFKMNDRT